MEDGPAASPVLGTAPPTPGDPAGAAADGEAKDDGGDEGGAAAASAADAEAPATDGEDAAAIPFLAAAAAEARPAATTATSQTVGALSAAIVGRAGAKRARFEVVLNPEGLGRVDVRLEIGPDGRLSAHMAFDRADSAAALGARVGELRQALAEAGFDVPPQSLRFEAASGGLGAGGFGGSAGFGGETGAETSRPAGARAFAAAAAAQADDTPAPARTPAGGLDILI